MKNKIYDCITFYQGNLLFETRFKILKDHVDYFIVCESIFDHQNEKKKLTLTHKENIKMIKK